MSLQTSPQINIVAEPLFRIGPINISNSMLLGVIGTLLMLFLLLYTKRRVQQRRRTRLAIAVLWLFEWLWDGAEDVMGSREAAKQAAPLGITMFFLIFINNWLGVLPFVGPVSWHGQPLFRGLSADMNFTFALALITFIAAQLWAVKKRGLLGDLGRYFHNPFTKPLEAFQGSLELLAEFTRTIALSLRLFGNIFGGEVLLLVVGYVAAWAAPIALPLFMIFELFFGAIQAYIFYMLTITFISLGSHESQSQHKPALAT